MTMRVEWDNELIELVRTRSALRDPVASIARDLRCSQAEISQIAVENGIVLTFTPAKLRQRSDDVALPRWPSRRDKTAPL
jgi:hypothetical protein